MERERERERRDGTNLRKCMYGLELLGKCIIHKPVITGKLERERKKSEVWMA